MFRTFLLIAVVTVTSAVFCDFAVAAPDRSFVRVAVDNRSSSVTVTGETRVDVVASVLRGLEKCSIPADCVTAVPWSRFPKIALDDADTQPRLTVCLSDRIEGGTKAAYICITPKFPFSTVAAVATELQKCGFADVRLLSEDTFRTEMLESFQVPPADSIGGETGEQGPDNVKEPEADPFMRRLDALRRTPLQEVGHAMVVEKYEELLSDFPNHDARAEALFDLAHLHELTIPAQNVLPNRAKTIQLLRKAHSVAAPNSPIWVTTGLHLHARIYRDNPEEAEQLVDSILNSNPSTIDELRAWNARQYMAAYQNDGEEVERIGRMMLKRMYSDEAPKELGIERMRYFQETQNGIHSMLNFWYHKGQTDKIRALGESYPYEFVQESIEQFRRRSDASKPTGTQQPRDAKECHSGSDE